jgi:hypothetical protein
MSAATERVPRVVQLAPAAGACALEDVLRVGAGAGEPFSPSRRATLAELSRRILQDPTLRADSASIALGYWLRRAQVERQSEAFARRCEAAPDTVFVPAGRVFHVAPGNVDTVFVYSWALSYLCGNANVVRVSGQQSPVLARLLAVLSDLMAEDAELAAGDRFVTYEHDEAVSAALSLWADHRVLWGGDETVSALRRLPQSPHASERAFASKFSYAVLCLDAYLAASDGAVQRLAAGFFNDVFTFDQMACSSPHLVFWVGAAEALDPALARFHEALAREIERRGYRGGASGSAHRLSFAFELACESEIRADLHQKEFLPLRIPDGAPWRKAACGAGLFGHVRLERLEDLAQRAEARDQTVTHFGFGEEELRTFARCAGARGVDRLVPVGEALAFDATWDGYDLIGDFLRRVSVRVGPS